MFKRDSDKESPNQSLFSFPKFKKEVPAEPEAQVSETSAIERKSKESFRLSLPQLTDPFPSIFRKKSKSVEAIVQTEVAEVEDNVQVEAEVAPAAEK
jgi:hypothetical protein